MREAVLFLVSFGICYGIQFVALLVLVEVLHLADTWAQLVSMVVYTLCNFASEQVHHVQKIERGE